VFAQPVKQSGAPRRAKGGSQEVVSEANLGPYLQAIDGNLRKLWDEGRGAVVGWCPGPNSLAVVAAPGLKVLERAPQYPRLVQGERRMVEPELKQIAQVLGQPVTRIPLRHEIGLRTGAMRPELVENLVRRYALIEVPYRAVFLLELADLAAAPPFEQVARLKTLEFSLNLVQRRARELGIAVELARQGTGDGFLVWNRAEGYQADVDLFQTLILLLADNAVARANGRPMVPEIRVAFTIASHLSYNLAEPGSSRGHEHFVGAATTTLRRLADKALSGQILFADFNRPVDEDDGTGVNTMFFVMHGQRQLRELGSIELGGDKVTSILTFLTGPDSGPRQNDISQFRIRDRHGVHHVAYNAKISVHRDQAQSVSLGLDPKALEAFKAVDVTELHVNYEEEEKRRRVVTA
jgi:hypothetical protein